MHQFQFPSNGKAYPKPAQVLAFLADNEMFQFPSNGKAYPKKKKNEMGGHSLLSFNPLQTGKPIQSAEDHPRDPLNAYPSFNSLQTGKPIQSYGVHTGTASPLGFNSLQTGKPIQSKLFR